MVVKAAWYSRSCCCSRLSFGDCFTAGAFEISRHGPPRTSGPRIDARFVPLAVTISLFIAMAVAATVLTRDSSRRRFS